MAWPTIDSKPVLVTGGTGFIGRHLISALLRAGADVAVLVRPERAVDIHDTWPAGSVSVIAADLLHHTSLDRVCEGISTVFHLAGYAHADGASHERGDEMHRCVTVDGTRVLLEQAAQAGVERFVFVSTVKTMGEVSPHRLDETSPARPMSAYGRSKLQAEQLVVAAAVAHPMHTSVIRLPLVYGRANKGNIPRMIAGIDRGRFPPPPEVFNKRSMVHVDDVVAALLLVAARPEARGQTYIITDGQVYSTRKIYDLIMEALGKPAPRWSVPLSLFRVGARVGDIVARIRGRPFFFDGQTFEKLFGSAWYSCEKIARELGYQPTRTLRDSLPEMVAEYRKQRAGR